MKYLVGRQKNGALSHTKPILCNTVVLVRYPRGNKTGGFKDQIIILEPYIICEFHLEHRTKCKRREGSIIHFE